MASQNFTFKQMIFDGLFWTYSLLLPIYFFFDKQSAEQNMRIISLGATGLLILTMSLSLFFHRFHLATLSSYIFGRPHKPITRSVVGLHLLLTLIVSIAIGGALTGASITELLDREGLQGVGRMVSQLAQPNFDLLPKAIVEIVETIFIAFLGTILAIPIAFVLCFFSAKNIMRGTWPTGTYLFIRTVLNLTRSMEPLVWAVIFTIWVGVGPFAGMLALWIHSVASLTKQFSEIVEGVDDGPIEAIRSTGANSIQTVWFGIVPQVTLPFISFTVYRWDINVRMATIIGMAGGGGIGTMLINFQLRSMWPEVGCIVLVIAAVVWLMDAASAHVREALK